MFNDPNAGGFSGMIASRLDNWRAHPFQSLISTLASGAGGFGAGMVANNLFGRYNNSRFNNSAQQLQDRSRDLATLNTNDSMNKPLGDDALNGDNGFNWDGPTGPNSGSGYGGEALTGGGSAGPYGGGGLAGNILNYSGPSMSGQQWMDRSGGYGNIIGQALGLAPDQSPFVNSLLDPISMGPGLPGSGHMNPQARRDYRDGTSNVGPGIGNYGVSNFMVGGSPVIFGTNGFDPNGAAVYNRRGVGY